MQQLIEQQQLICQVVLPLPPSINTSYKRVTYKKRVTGGMKTIRRFGLTDEAVAFKEHARLTLKPQLAGVDKALIHRLKQEKIPLRMDVRFYFTTLWKRDRDGGLKIAQDILFECLGLSDDSDNNLNDNRIVAGYVNKYADRNNPRVEIELYLAGDNW